MNKAFELCEINEKDVKPVEPVEAISDKQQVDGNKLLSDIVAALKRYVIMPKEDYLIAALWAAHTYHFRSWFITPYLLITSPEPGCGKSTLQRVLKEITCNPIKAGSMTVSALFRIVDKSKPTLFIDEADTFIKGDDYEGIINDGYAADGARYLSKETVSDWEPKLYSVFCPKCLAYKGRKNIWDPLFTRSFEIRLLMKKPGEKTKEYNPDDVDDLSELRQRLFAWSEQNSTTIKRTRAVIPEQIDNRVKDNWKPLLHISQIIGKDWYDQICELAIARTSEPPQRKLSEGIRLLLDIKFVFNMEENKDKEYMSAEEIIGYLSMLEWSNWGNYLYGKHISTNDFADILGEYHITWSRKRGSGKDRNNHVWRRTDFEDQWSRIPASYETDSTDSTASTDAPKTQRYTWDKPAVERTMLDVNEYDGGPEYRDVLIRDGRILERDEALNHHKCPDGGYRTYEEIELWNADNPEKPIHIEGFVMP